MKPKAMAELAAAISDHKSTPNMSDKFRHLFLDKVQNREQAGLKVVKNQDKATIRIYDVIGWPFVMAEDVARALEDIDSEQIEVQINSPGGDAFDGIAIFNALRTHDARITTRVDGLAASAASIVAQAGDHRVMLTGSEMMVHEAWGITIGPEQDHLDNAAALHKLSWNMADIYAARAGSDEVGEFYDLMKAETWLTSDETVEAGLADESVKPERPPQDSAPQKFIDQLEAAIAAVEEVTSETENVVTFRSDQGKPPLSNDAVALVARAKAALKGLSDVAEPTSKRREELLARVAEARAQLDTESQRMEKYQ